MPIEVRRRGQIPGNWSEQVAVSHCVGVEKPNPGLLEEQPELLTAKPSVQNHDNVDC